MRPFTLLIPLLLPACSVHVSGTVDGEDVGGAREAIFDKTTVSIPFLGTYDVLLLLLTDAKDSCALVDALADVDTDSCASECGDLVEIDERVLGRDAYWTLLFSVIVSDSVERSFPWDGGLGEDTFTATWSALDTSRIHDLETCAEFCEDDEATVPQDDFSVDGGTLTIDRFEENELLKGEFDASFDGLDETEGRFTAEHCDLSEYFWWE